MGYLLFIFIGIITYFLIKSKPDKKTANNNLTVRPKAKLISSNSTNSNSISIALNENSDNYSISAGDILNLWVPPSSNEIFVYPKVKNIGDNKPIGTFISRSIASKYPSNSYRIKARILKYKPRLVEISGNLIVINKFDEAKGHNDKFFNQIVVHARKPLKASVNFFMGDDFQWNSKVYLSFGDVDHLLEEAARLNDWEYVKKSFWLNDEFGKKISLRNGTRKSDVLKVIRNFKSGHTIHLKYKKEQRDGNVGRGGHYAWNCVE